MELFVEREVYINGSPRLSFGKGDKGKSYNEEAPGLNRLKHAIVVSDAMARSRRSDELLRPHVLVLELLTAISSRRWASYSTTASAATSSMVANFVGGGKRCMSEISGLSRSIGGKKLGGAMAGASSVNGGKKGEVEEKLVGHLSPDC